MRATPTGLAAARTRGQGRTCSRRVSRALRMLVLAAAGAVCLGGCGGRQSILAPRSQQTHVIAVLWWWMLAAAVVVFIGAIGLLVLSFLKRRSAGLPYFGRRERLTNGMVIAFGIAIPLVVLLALFGASDIYDIRFTEAPAADSTSMTIDVIGHQWWWEIRYPGTTAVTANEIHIPVGTRIQVVATTADVIHSLWVPRLARKINMIPGRENRILLDTPDAGTYLGQCSEFCGLQHAHMGVSVIAEPRASFQAWLANMARPASLPTGGRTLEGERLFMSRGCGGCHQLRGTQARGMIGPDLTHVATRSTLAALEIPNTAAELAAWVHDPQAIKPGNHMPDLGLSSAEARTIAVFLESLH
ncbi:MAG: cytochrome c oxidase subunit II [Solirubrobacteraceae bacterium]